MPIATLSLKKTKGLFALFISVQMIYMSIFFQAMTRVISTISKFYNVDVRSLKKTVKTADVVLCKKSHIDYCKNDISNLSWILI